MIIFSGRISRVIYIFLGFVVGGGILVDGDFILGRRKFELGNESNFNKIIREGIRFNKVIKFFVERANV